MVVTTQISPDREPGTRETPAAALPELTALLEGLDVGVLVHGPTAAILYANDQALALLGLRNDQVLGVTSLDPSWDIVRPDGTPFPADQRPVSRVLVTGLYNRTYFLELMDTAAERAVTAGQTACLAYIRVDRYASLLAEHFSPQNPGPATACK